MTLVALRADTRSTPLGIDAPRPRLAWQAVDEDASCWQVQVSSSDDFSAPLWDAEADEFALRYDGPPLESATRYRWRVRSIRPVLGPWSESSWFETAFLEPERWRADWVGAPAVDDDDSAVYVRGEFTLTDPIASARLYSTALGWYRVFVNGVAVSGDELLPRFTPLDEILEYQVFDVAEHLVIGKNVISMAVADGRFRGRLGADRQRVYGDRLAARAQLEVRTVADGLVTVTSGPDWTRGRGRIQRSDPKAGESIDLRVNESEWHDAEVAPAAFLPVEVITPTVDRALVAEEVERVRGVMTLAPSSVSRLADGRQIVAFDQNFTGVPRIRVSGDAGDVVTLTYSEVLAADGTIDTAYVLPPGPLSKNSTIPRDEIILGGRQEWVQPWFTIHGFQYVEVAGLSADLSVHDVQGVVLSSDLESRATFTSSDARLERLFRNVEWSLRGNFVDTATDCPTRERRGWTGDIQVFAPTAAIMVDAQAFLERYLRNLAIEQGDDGRVPAYIPQEGSTFSSMDGGAAFGSAAAGWADAAVLTPWDVYLYTGDPTVLERQWDSARRWVEYRRTQARASRGRGRWLTRSLGKREQYIVGGGLHYGEWLRPGETMPRQIYNIAVPNPAIATAYFAHSSAVLGRMAAALGREGDAREYSELSDAVSDAWRSAFVRRGGARIGKDLQDEYVRALEFDLLLPAQRTIALSRLVELLEANDYRLATGFLSTPHLLRVLTEHGRVDVAYRVLLQTSAPSWLHQVELGATTVWETWEGYRPDGRAKDSHNHYALGTVARWLVEGLAGIAPAAPGYQRIRLSPAVHPGLTSAHARIATPFGEASSGWSLTGGTVTLRAVVPPGTTAEVDLPGGARTVAAGTHEFTWRLEQTASPSASTTRGLS
ncbi:alpha-L-rhamnosidase [Rathayibacter sp. VKM Ac-2760]|uniref:alpha-L-rhamnosidase n=1 Tax=Rathayibacter sp. VKM Ac-2760 TaxID=2609253 RepID=UPI001316FE9C|nr:alpha-L-rhamnosidase [Rathayibacter sp. VKM Ac-2760]QHC61057.1 family 78 glycoside hydrolase catalytic domain [Rathayibacter sp. VKM Ac-2760]